MITMMMIMMMILMMMMMMMMMMIIIMEFAVEPGPSLMCFALFSPVPLVRLWVSPK